MTQVAVVGAGIAGLAAAFAASRAGAKVTLVDGGTGASSLAPGAVDDLPWDELARMEDKLGVAAKPRALSSEAQAFVDALDLVDVPADRRVLLATSAGVLRGARGHDRALLDLDLLAKGTVVLPRVDRAGWDADALATTLQDDARARARALEFLAVDADVLRFDGERFVGDADLAARHDDPARLAWLAERLAPLTRGACAVLLGPWLGAKESRAASLSERLRLPVGEVLTGSGATSGLRFDAARSRFAHALGPSLVHRFGRVVAIERDGDHFEIAFDADERSLVADRVVLAIGGLVGGGVVYAPPEHGLAGDFPERAGASFRLSLDFAEVRLAAQADGEVLGATSSMHGPELDLDAWPRGSRAGWLERVGIAAKRVDVGRMLFAAGDALAGRPRTMLTAIASGIAAGVSAAR